MIDGFVFIFEWRRREQWVLDGRAAIDRLQAWWRPQEPLCDETSPRFMDGRAALARDQYYHAIMRFRRVLKIRLLHYEKKYASAAVVAAMKESDHVRSC